LYPYSDVPPPLSKSGLSKSHSALGEPALGEWREKRDIFAGMNLRLLTLSMIFLAFPAMDARAQDTPGLQLSPKPGDSPVKAVSRPPAIPDIPLPDKDSLPVPAVTDTLSVSRRMLSQDEMFPVKGRFPTVYGPYVGGYMNADPRLKVTAPVRRIPMLLRSPENRDWVFYFFCGLLLTVALVKVAFPKYFSDMFRVFFQSSPRNLQLREQLTQTPLPSLLLNLVFILAGGAFLFFLIRNYGIYTGYGQFATFQIISGIIAAVYIVKYLFISLLGWMFDRRAAAGAYLFTVFQVNKAAGLALIPLSLLMAYAPPGEGAWVLTLALTVLGILLLVRLAKGFQAVHALRINLVQFLLFVAAFEVVPVLLIGKVLLRFID